MDFIRTRLQRFQNKIGAVLDGETQNDRPSAMSVPMAGESASTRRSATERVPVDAPNVEAGVPFATRNDFATLDELLRKLAGGMALASLKNPTEMFLQLSPYFEAGFLMSRNSENALSTEPIVLDALFMAGHLYRLSKSERQVVDLRPPTYMRHGVMRGRVTTVFEKFRMPVPKSLATASAFLFAPSKEQIVVLICNRAPLWQTDAIESAYRFLVTGFTELASRQGRKKSRWFSLNR